MCIRDSRYPAAQRSGRLRFVSAGGAGGRGREHCRRGAGRSHAPVSYTHLRAHETVLDLVCRLLLEQKKYTSKL